MPSGNFTQLLKMLIYFTLNLSALYMASLRRYIASSEFRQLAKTLDALRMSLAAVYFVFVTVADLQMLPRLLT